MNSPLGGDAGNPSSLRNRARNGRQFGRQPGNQAHGPSLRALPADFGWQVLSKLSNEFIRSELLSNEFAAELLSTIRSRDVARYYSLDERWGLQCMSSARGSPGGYPPAVRQLTALLRKFPAMGLISPDQRRAACLATVKSWDEKLGSVRFHRGGVLSECRDVVREILGDKPDLDEVLLLARHGPGSAQSIPLEKASSYFKYGTLPYRCYSGSVPLLKRLICEDQRWLHVLLKRTSDRFVDIDAFLDTCIEGVDVNRVSTVPKDGRKDRPIAVEPAGAVMLQLGVDGVIRRRLRAFGCDLNSQAKNQRLARRASVDGSLVTLDLSNASDSVSCDLLGELLPPDWYQLVMSLRAKRGAFPDGSEITYVKFASMGNGMTFVIQTVCFLALIAAVERLWLLGERRPDHAVYGDDLICLKEIHAEVLFYLRDWGFVVNSEKSFFDGFVTESCGTDWVDGQDIRPVFLNKAESLLDIIAFRNRLNRWFFIHLGTSCPPELDSYLLSFWKGEFLFGPVSNECFSGYWHTTWYPYPIARPVRELAPLPFELKAEDLDYRKLMHPLRDCTSETGGRFVVTQRVDRPRTRVRTRLQWFSPYGDDL